MGRWRCSANGSSRPARPRSALATICASICWATALSSESGTRTVLPAASLYQPYHFATRRLIRLLVRGHLSEYEGRKSPATRLLLFWGGGRGLSLCPSSVSPDRPT